MQRERAARRTLLAIGSDDRDVAEHARRRREYRDPRGEIPVVVGAEDVHGHPVPAERLVVPEPGSARSATCLRASPA